MRHGQQDYHFSAGKTLAGSLRDLPCPPEVVWILHQVHDLVNHCIPILNFRLRNSYRNNYLHRKNTKETHEDLP